MTDVQRPHYVLTSFNFAAEDNLAMSRHVSLEL